MRVLVPLLLGLTTMTHAQTPSQPRQLRNHHYLLEVRDGRTVSLRCDARGRRAYGASVGSWGFEHARDAREVIATGDALVYRQQTAYLPGRIAITQLDRPDRLLPGRTLGQSFDAPGEFSAVKIKIPTWHTDTAAATLELLRDGRVIAARALENIVDNSFPTLEFPRQPPGLYQVRLRDPRGMVGWWSSSARRYAGGSALVDDQPDLNAERYLEVTYEVPYGTAETTIRLDGPRLIQQLRVEPYAPAAAEPHPMIWLAPFVRDGYDTSAAATPFTRFYNDQQRLMPIEQLKRTEDPGLSLHGERWLHIDGTGHSDYTLDCGPHGLSWRVAAESLSCVLKLGALQPLSTPAGAFVQAVTLSLETRRDRFPADWPSFALPDRRDARDVNRLFYERNFSFHAPAGGAVWVEWQALARAWFAGPLRDLERKNVADLVMADDGYVYTWGSEPGWPFPDPSRYDTRHFDTNARFILAAWRHALWSGDDDFLRGQAQRLRAAMAYQLDTLRGRDGLIIAASPDVTGNHRGVGNNYWDILPFGHLDAYANIVFYASLEAMEQLERRLAQLGMPGEPPERYAELRARCRAAYNETFWDEQEGRYIGCIGQDGRRRDYGFTFLNLEAMAYGLADAHQVERIYHWLEHGVSSTGEADIYSAWIFAPRATTLHNPMWNEEHPLGLPGSEREPWWFFGWHGTPFGDQCQDGGAIFYTSFFDLMARLRYRGPDDAWQRWSAILARYRMPDRLCGGPPLCRGEIPQQVNPGSVGLDLPFPESGMVPCWMLYGVLGVTPTFEGLRVQPRLPRQLPWCAVHNVSFQGQTLSLKATRTSLRVTQTGPDGRARAKTYRLPAQGGVLVALPL